MFTIIKLSKEWKPNQYFFINIIRGIPLKKTYLMLTRTLKFKSVLISLNRFLVDLFKFLNLIPKI